MSLFKVKDFLDNRMFQNQAKWRLRGSNLEKNLTINIVIKYF